MLKDLEVYMGSRRASAISHESYNLSSLDSLTLPHYIAFVMGIQGHQAISVVKHHCISITIWSLPAKHHYAPIRCDNRCPSLAGEVNSTVKPSASHAKTRAE